MRLVVQQYDRALAARSAIGGQQCAQAAHQGIGRRQRIGGGTCRAGGSALSASSANPRVDRYVIARRHDRAGRAEAEAAIAPDDLRTRVGAEIFGKSNVTRLFETADEVPCPEHGL